MHGDAPRGVTNLTAVMRRARFTLALTTCAWSLLAQPRFDVASVKRMPPRPLHGLISEITPTSVTLRYATLGNCIQWAYGYGHLLVIGPDWRDRPTDVFYDITGKTSAPVAEAELKRMMQSLLRERLGLRLHEETRSLKAFSLEIAAGGPKLTPSTGGGDPSIKSVAHFSSRFENFSIADFIQSIENTFASRIVVDKTGLTGKFDFTLDTSAYVLDPTTGKAILDWRGAVDEESAYIQALPKQLGLKFEPTVVPGRVLVIDEVRKDPVEN